MKAWISLFFILSLEIVSASQCEELTGWLKFSHESSKESLSIKERWSLIEKTRENEYLTAWHIVDRYQKGILSSDFFTDCLNEPYFEQLKSKISAELKKQALKNLEKSDSQKVQTLVKTVENSGKLFIFQAKFDIDPSTTRRAGFHRMSGAMYYVLPEIPAHEFKLHLVHELLHKFDEDILYKTSIDFSDKETNLYLYNLAQEKTSFNELNEKDQNMVRTYILNGLRRGFLAEFKVWASSYRLYGELKSSGEIEELSWVENILNQQGSEDYLDFIFNYYAERFERPERKSLFHWDLFQDSYDVVMQELYETKNKCALMDDLKVFINECVTD